MIKWLRYNILCQKETRHKIRLAYRPKQGYNKDEHKFGKRGQLIKMEEKYVNKSFLHL